MTITKTNIGIWIKLDSYNINKFKTIKSQLGSSHWFCVLCVICFWWDKTCHSYLIWIMFQVLENEIFKFEENICDFEEDLNGGGNIPDDVRDTILTVIGMAKLLMAQKLTQFRELCYKNIVSFKIFLSIIIYFHLSWEENFRLIFQKLDDMDVTRKCHEEIFLRFLVQNLYFFSWHIYIDKVQPSHNLQ